MDALIHAGTHRYNDRRSVNTRNDRINVLHVADKFGVSGSSIHGVTRLFSWWLPAFDAQRYHVRLVGLRRPDAATDLLKAQGIDVISLGRGRFDPRTLTDLVRLVRRAEIDVLHVHGYGSTNFGILAAQVTGVKCIVHEHFVDPRRPIYQVPIDFALGRLADYGIAVSQSVKEFMVRQRHIPEARVEVIYNGAPLHEFKPAARSDIDAERSRWGIAPHHRVVTTIGRVDTQKGGRFFIDAMPAVLERHPDVTFLVVGDGPLLEEMKRRVMARNVQHAVVFTGFHTNIPLIQSLTSIQVFPSLWEGTPLTLFEAMSMRLPIVSTDVDGLGEVLEHGTDALIVAPRNPQALAAAICDLLDHPDKADRLAAAALARSAAFDIQKTVDRMEAVYEEVLQEDRHKIT